MNIQRAQELSNQYQMTMVQGLDYVFELYFRGKFIGELHPAQIGEMNEEDFIMYYLDEGISPNVDEYDF